MTASPVVAQVDPFEFEVYPYQTLGVGMVELESLNSVVPKGHARGGNGTASGDFKSNLMYRTAFEVSYGLTDKIEAAVYLNLARPNGDGSFQYAGSKYRLRGSLFEQDELPVNLGWYAELEWHRVPEFDGNQLEVELRPIIEKDFGRVEIDLDPKFEKAIFLGPNKNRGFEFGYVAGIYYRAMRWLSPGLEFYGGIGHLDDSDPLRDQQHYIFPILRGELPGGIEYNFGPGFGLTRGSDRRAFDITREFPVVRCARKQSEDFVYRHERPAHTTNRDQISDRASVDGDPHTLAGFHLPQYAARMIAQFTRSYPLCS
jgi:hypothetical protein